MNNAVKRKRRTKMKSAKTVAKHIIEMEKGALDKYYAGDMTGYYDIWSHDDFSYFDT
ncbi:hypothetical protein FD32_GL000006 [Limosilactobacillus panis DSM 6035]|uniref:Uncharacterized protein n=1 Tax=Limosilactobacillus panis DSM 6035 TaxID=1423782 RepID=A0A0R1XD08_9LACO|nr:hypothetical protein FD32_GL000006 [Limosilactobacillus panis DSM 6035]